MTPALALHDLRKSYDGRPVLRGVTLQVADGERVALVGPNGSGKTTLLRSVLGFVRAEGRVAVHGVDPWADHASAMTRVAYVPQRAPALPAPVGELGAAWANLRGVPHSALVGAARAFGLDLHALRAVRFTELSGGMQQKLLAAMALASSASLLCFDEPTANLDPEAREVFLDALRARTPTPTILLSSHRIEELQDLVDRVVVLAEGEVRFDDRLEAFLARPELATAAGVTRGAVVPLRRPPP